MLQVRPLALHACVNCAAASSSPCAVALLSIAALICRGNT
jgi:hypothetical protein